MRQRCGTNGWEIGDPGLVLSSASEVPLSEAVQPYHALSFSFDLIFLGGGVGRVGTKRLYEEYQMELNISPFFRKVLSLLK